MQAAGSTTSLRSLGYTCLTVAIRLKWMSKLYSFPVSDTPMAYFITFRAYGTWLPGDARGAVRHGVNVPGSPPVQPSSGLEIQSRSLLRSEMAGFDATCRDAIGLAIKEVCEIRGWNLIALNVRSNHVHVIVQCEAAPERALVDFKSYATRRLVLGGLFAPNARVWARHGSTRYLWDDGDVEDAWRYVVHGQGPDM